MPQEAIKQASMYKQMLVDGVVAILGLISWSWCGM